MLSRAFENGISTAESLQRAQVVGNKRWRLTRPAAIAILPRDAARTRLSIRTVLAMSTELPTKVAPFTTQRESAPMVLRPRKEQLSAVPVSGSGEGPEVAGLRRFI